MRLKHDEDSGIAETVLAGSVSRWRWLLSAVGATFAGSAVLMFLAGLGNGLGAAATMADAELVPRLTLAGLAHLPAMAVMAGVGALCVAVRQPLLGWLAVTYVVLALYLGALLRLPRWLIDASPVGRTTAPAHTSATALAVMVAVAIALTATAGFVYRRRDAI
jgi:ABC-2 type transport system permease protein